MKTKFAYLMFLILTFSMLSSMAVAKSRDAAGQVVFVLGQAVAKSPDGKTRPLKRKSPVFSEDLIVTNNKSQLQVRFADNGFVSIRPNSKFKIDKFSYRKGNSRDANHFQLVKGGFRAITGQIGKVNKKAFKLKTPVGTLGIRGTDFTAMFCANDCGGGFRQGGDGAENGLYVGVVSGGVELVNRAGTLLLSPNQYGFVKGLSASPVSLPKPPSFLMFDRTRSSAKKLISKLRGPKKDKGKKGGNKKGGSNDKEQLASNGSESEQKSDANNKSKEGGGVPAALSGVAGEMAQQASLDSQELGDSGTSFSLLSDVISERFGLESNELLPSSSTKLSGGGVIGEAGGTATDAARDLINTSNVATDVELGNLGLLSGFGGDDGGSGGGDSTVPTDELNTSIQPTETHPELAFLMTAAPIQTVTGDGLLTDENAVIASFDGYSIRSVISDTTNPDHIYQETEYKFIGEILDVGHDPATGLRWGRWADGGSIDYETELQAKNTQIGESMHWIVGAQDSVIRSLPIEGTASYVMFGNTVPTDNFGNRGVVGHAQLDANFTTQTMDVGVNLTMGQNNWGGAHNNMPLNGSGRFDGDLTVGIAPVSNPLLQTQGTGKVAGFFTGQDGQIPDGAGMVYQMQGNVDGQETVINGTAAFRRQ